MRNTKVGRIAVLVLCSVLLFFSLYPVFTSPNNRYEEYVEREFLSCVVAICVVDARVGHDCRYMSPTLSQVLVTIDSTNSDLRRIVLNPTEAKCK